MPDIRSRRRIRLIATTAAVGLTAATALAAGSLALAAPQPQPVQPEFDSGSYVVVLAEQPAATYEGDIQGFTRTAPLVGESLQIASSAVSRYREHLLGRQQELAEAVGIEPIYQYTVAVNGFAAELSGEQAAELEHTPGVRAVVEDTPREVDTVSSPGFLGLSESGDDKGVWDSLGGPDDAGHGVVVGVIDTGIWPENPSFAGDELRDKPSDDVGEPYRTSETGTAMVKANGATFTGECQPGEEWSADLCNEKLISARYFAEGFLDNVSPEHHGEYEQISARDSAGHGSHTASTAAGNHDVEMSVNAREFGAGSGMAPAAKIAAYKVCWEDDDETTGGGCYPSDAVAAIDQAIIDGVDVINYSISGVTDTVVDPVELAFLSAASANIFVAVSAGNSGPGSGTVAHNSPWVTTVAASTHASYEGTVELGDGQRVRGAMISDTGIPEQTPLVYAGDIPADGVSADDAALCAPDSLDDAAAAGAVVLCDRGTYPRVDKSAEVDRAGGIGSILGNTDPSEGLNADFHVIPTTHVAADDAEAIRDYAGSAETATAALLVGDQTDLPPTPTPVVAGFSSRGPALANGGDVLKPDITAPGVDVLAAVAPGPHGDNDFDFISGTSMASPHIAGLAALIRAAEPEWSAMAVKSAMMTSAYDLKTTDGSPDTDHFNSGAGHVDPTRFFHPGLVYESRPDEWLAFLKGIGEDIGIPGVEPIDPSDLNQPSIAVGALAGRQQIVRTVTAVRPGLYRADIDLPGFKAKVKPSMLFFARPGQEQQFTVTLTPTTAPLDTYAQGTLTWSDGRTEVRSPIVAMPVAVAAPPEVSGRGSEGEISYEVVPGTTGDVDLTLRGLAPGEVTTGTVAPGEGADPNGNTSSHVVEFDVPEDTSLARFELVAAATDSDFDMYVYGPDGEQLTVNGATGASSERVDLSDPAAGTYRVVAHIFSSAGGSPADFTVRNFALGTGPDGNATIEPDPIPGQLGKPSTVTLTYSGLEEGVPYLGIVDYEGTDATTVVSVE